MGTTSHGHTSGHQGAFRRVTGGARAYRYTLAVVVQLEWVRVLGIWPGLSAASGKLHRGISSYISRYIGRYISRGGNLKLENTQWRDIRV